MARVGQGIVESLQADTVGRAEAIAAGSGSQLARELLDDVGRPDSDFEDVQDKSYQIIRQLTIEEERLVGKAKAPSAKE